MIKRQLKQLNYYNRNIASREDKLMGIESRKKFELAEFGKKVRISKVPIPFDTAMKSIEQMIRQHRTESSGDIGRMTSIISFVLTDRLTRLDNADNREMNLIRTALDRTGFPKDWRDIRGGNRTATKAYINAVGAEGARPNIGRFNAFAIMNYDTNTNLQRITGPLSPTNPLYRYISTGGPNITTDYKFEPTRLSILRTMPDGWLLDIKYSAIYPGEIVINNAGALTIPPGAFFDEPVEEEEEEGEEEEAPLFEE